MQRLSKVGSSGCNAFIHEPISIKEMWDGVQFAHSKRASVCGQHSIISSIMSGNSIGTFDSVRALSISRLLCGTTT
jgi:hypothetical protein